MKIGLIGDVHAEDERLERVLDRFHDERLDLILAVGDFADGHGDLDRCVRLLRGSRALAVRGNHDRWLLQGVMRGLPEVQFASELAPETLAFLSSLPATREVITPYGTLLLCHGVGEDDMQRLTPDDFGYALECNGALIDVMKQNRFRYLVGGHTHRVMARSLSTRIGDQHHVTLTVLNAGTLARESEGFVAIADLEQGKLTLLDAANGSTVVGSLPLPTEPERF